MNKKIIFSLLFSTTIVFATVDPGDLDASFGTSGIVLTDLDEILGVGFTFRINEVAFQANRKIVAGGEFNNGSNNVFALARYNPNGILDSSFGQDGVVVTDFNDEFPGGDESYLQSVLVQSDGKIVAGGAFFDGSTTTSFALARYNPDGSLDSSFGFNGLVITDFNDESETTSEIASIALQSDGKIVAGGIFNDGSNNVFALARYNSDGSLDTAFGMNGLVITDFNDEFPGGSLSDIRSIAIQKDGKIVAGGGFNDGSNNVLALARYNADGSLDKAFGMNGLMITAISDIFANGTNAMIDAIALQKDGKIVATGLFVFTGSTNDDTLGVARYLTNGQLDQSFGTQGLVSTEFKTIFGDGEISSSGMQSVAIQVDSKITVGATYKFEPDERAFALARYHTDGTLDNTFGRFGRVVTNFNLIVAESDGNGDAEIDSILLQSNGKIVGGGKYDPLLDEWALARYLSGVATSKIAQSIFGKYSRMKDRNRQI